MCDAAPLEPPTYSRDVLRSCDVGQRCPLPRYVRKCLFSKGIWSPRHNYGAATPAAAPAAAPAATTEDPPRSPVNIKDPPPSSVSSDDPPRTMVSHWGHNCIFDASRS